MAIHESLASKITSVTEGWLDHTGQEVEDFVCRNIITDGEYDTDALELHLKRTGNTDIVFPVTVQTPNYIYGILVYGIRLDGKVYNSTELLMQYRTGRKVELGIAIRSVADRSGNQSTITKPFDVKIDMVTNNENKTVRQSITSEVYPTSHEYFLMDGTNLVLNVPEGTNVSDVIAWVDVTKMFTKSFKNYTFTASFEQVTENVNRTYTHTLNMNIVNEVINLIYTGGVVINNNYIQMTFDPISTDVSKYKLVIFNGNDPVQINNPGDMMVSNLKPGLNQLQVKAVSTENPDVYTDWFFVDIIYSEGVTDTVVAVNGVSKGITNNGVATLYSLTVYSPKQEEISITTYLDDNEPDNDRPNPTNIIKSEVINPSQYNVETNLLVSKYKKYIEINSDNARKYLVVKIGEDYYRFFSPGEMMGDYFTDTFVYKSLEVESIIEEYTYVKTYPVNYNFDLITGYTNNLFVTDTYATADNAANISSNLESSDGWHEQEGRVYFKASANVNPVFKSPVNLGLGQNFTIELGFKSYNVSNIDNPVFTLGKLQLRPTMVCWDVDRSAYDDTEKGQEAFEAALLSRMSKFQEGVETHLTITLDSNWNINPATDKLYYPDYLQGTNQTVFDQNASKFTHNLLRIYINGCIDREVFLDDSEATQLRNSLLNINPTSSDIDFYLFRVYNNNSLGFSEIVRNYVAFLPEKTGRNSKEDIYNRNDILDDNGLISWEKCLNKYNTLLFVFPAGGRFPNRFWGGADGDAEDGVCKKAWTSLFINYADPEVNVKYGGRLNKLQVKGLGSSAMRYLIWNVNSSLNKFKDADDNKIKSEFTPNGLLNPKSVPENYSGIEALSVTKGKYVMPIYSDKVDTTEYGYTKMVGKVNYASSMQSHKPGACKLFDDAYKKNITSSLPSGGLKAVHEEPYLYFYIEAPEMTNEQCAELTWDQVMEMSSQIKFMGFLTWGPGKGDDTCSGYDEDKTPEYLMLEGGENGDNSVNFLVPWHNLQRLTKIPGQEAISYTDLQPNPVCTKEESLADPSKNILIDDESVVYLESGAWDIDYGVDEIKAGKKGNPVKYFKFLDSVIKSPGGNPKSSLQWFREFYDFVYKYDFTFEVASSDVQQPTDWDSTKKYLVMSGTFKPDGVTAQQGHQAYDMYRYDRVNEAWVPAGLFYTNSKWERLNYRELSELSSLGIGSSSSHSVIRRALKQYFTNNIGKYVDINDISFHQAFVKFLSGTDNRAKNTYFQIIGPLYEEVEKVDENGDPILNEDGEPETEFVMSAVDENTYKIRLIGDDLDTILATDNNGLQSKAYNLVEDSYDESYNKVWGDLGNIFFRMYDICFEDDIKSKLTGIMTTAGVSPSSINSTGTYFYNTFFKIQEDFPAIAYNHTAKIYYENAAIIKEVGLKVDNSYDFDYKHNDVEPIEQSHGSSLECEKQFMKERLAYLAGYSQASKALDGYVSTGRSGGSGAALRLKLEFEPFLDFYPIYQFGTSVDAGFTSFGDLQQSLTSPASWKEWQEASNTRKKVALKDHKYTTQITTGTTTAINQGLYQVNLYKSLNITGLSVPDLKGSFDRATTFEIDNNNLQDSFFDGWGKFTMNSNDAQLPVVENLSLKNIVLPDTLSLLTYYKLKTLDLTGSTTKYVEFPQTGNLTNVILPSSITEFRIYNNPGLKDVRVISNVRDNNGNMTLEEDLSKLEIVYINCAKCGEFDVSDFCEKLASVTSLKEITIVNANNLRMTESTISILSSKKCRLTGSFWIVDDIKSATPQTVAISFTTKEQLVNNFGVITNSKNDTYIRFEEKTIYNGYATCQERINLYLSAGEESAEFVNAFGLSISDGNNIAILEDLTNPYNPSVKGRLNISYSLNSRSGVSKIDPKTGVITVTGTSTKEDTITINIVTTSGPLTPLTCTLVCSWVAPKVGDFAYVDGTFSSAYNKSKTLAGLVYDKTYTGSGDSETGTAYIIGKEFSCLTPLYSGVNLQGADANSTSTGAIEVNKLKVLLSNFGLANYSTISEIDGINETGLSILPENKTRIDNLVRTGKEDTLKYVSHVGTFLNKLKTDDPSYNSYYNPLTNLIESNEKLLLFLDKLEVNNYLSKHDKTSTKDYELDYTYYNKTLLYPYFYSMYLYEPVVTLEELNADEDTKFKNAYKKNNWYAPSQGELAKVLYCRGVSESDSFNNTTIQGQELKNINNELGIFAKAKAKMGDDMPLAWVDLLRRGNNITTNVYASGTDNYGYNIYSYNTGLLTGAWTPGSPSQDVNPNDYQLWYTYADSIWRMNTHNGIPFTQYDYAKPNN